MPKRPREAPENPMWVFDFTFPVDRATLAFFVQLLRHIFKKWCFQHEMGDSGYLHYQGRGSLIKKRRLGEAAALVQNSDLRGMRLSVSSLKSQDDGCFYTLKLDTRIAGPWDDRSWKDPPYIPRQYRGLEDRLYPYQQAILDSRHHFDPRVIDVILDPQGNRGKSTIATLGRLLHRGVELPCIPDHKELIQVVCNKLRDSQNRTPEIVLCDMPRAVSSDFKRMAPYLIAIEQIKKGYVFDCRNHFKDWDFDSPRVWLFVNSFAPENLCHLSQDRWRFWSINVDGELFRAQI